MGFGAAASDEHRAKEAPFNFSMLYYIGLNKLLDQKDAAAASGDIFGWFSGLKAVRRRIWFKLAKHERTGVENKVKTIASTLRSEFSGSESLQMQAQILVAQTVGPLLDELDMYLWDLMDRYKMIFPNIELKGGLKDVMKRYKDLEKGPGDSSG